MKVTDTKGPGAVSKKKKTGKTGQTSGVSFASLVEAASAAAETGTAESTGAVGGYTGGGGHTDGDAVPEDARGRGNYMLEKLEELELDILSGAPTAAIERLKEALATKAIDRDQLSPRARQLLDEIDLRVSVEIAKMEESGKKG